MQENKVSAKEAPQAAQDELDRVYRDLLAQAQGVQSKWRAALTSTQTSPGRADLVRYIRFVIRAVDHTAQIFAEALQAQASQEQIAALLQTAEQSRQSLGVLSAQCDDFVRRNAPLPERPAGEADPAPSHESYAQSLYQLRRYAQSLARRQVAQRALVNATLGIRELSDDKLVLRALRAMGASLDIERELLRRRRLTVRAFASLPVIDLERCQRRVNRWSRKTQRMAADLESRERYLAHLITWH